MYTIYVYLYICIYIYTLIYVYMNIWIYLYMIHMCMSLRTYWTNWIEGLTGSFRIPGCHHGHLPGHCFSLKRFWEPITREALVDLIQDLWASPPPGRRAALSQRDVHRACGGAAFQVYETQPRGYGNGLSFAETGEVGWGPDDNSQ